MESAQYSKLFSYLWNIANDVLVQAFEKGDYKKIILPFMGRRRIVAGRVDLGAFEQNAGGLMLIVK